MVHYYGENTFPTGRVCFPLPSQRGASIPRPWPVLDRRGRSAITKVLWLSSMTQF